MSVLQLHLLLAAVSEDRSQQPIRPFVLSTRHPPSSNALRAPGLVDVVHRDRGGLGLPTGQPEATSISPRTTVTPLSYIPQPCNGPKGPKGLQPNKPKNQTDPRPMLWLSSCLFSPRFCQHVRTALSDLRRPVRRFVLSCLSDQLVPRCSLMLFGSLLLPCKRFFAGLVHIITLPSFFRHFQSLRKLSPVLKSS